MNRRRRAAVYALVGTALDLGLNRLAARRRGERFELQTSPWMLLLYALLQPLFEPVHDALDGRASWPTRGAVYAGGFMAVEYAAGRVFRGVRGAAPWDYSHARWSVHGLTRLDYFPLWAAEGLALERVHERLVGLS